MTSVQESLSTEIWELVRAGFSGIWIETHEPSEAILELSAMCAEHRLRLLVWNLDSGLRNIGGDPIVNESADPLSAVRALGTIEDQTTLLILENFHRFIDSPEICQAVLTQLQLGKQLGRHIIVLAPRGETAAGIGTPVRGIESSLARPAAIVGDRGISTGGRSRVH